jgi:hypothetical protein
MAVNGRTNGNVPKKEDCQNKKNRKYEAQTEKGQRKVNRDTSAKQGAI